MERKIGYARSATANQGTEDQEIALKAAGCSEVFSDIGVSGLILKRPGLLSAMASLQPGDQLVVQDVSRISRSTTDALLFVDELMRKHVDLLTLGNPEESKALELLVNYPTPRFVRPGPIRVTLHRILFWLAPVMKRLRVL